MDEERGHDGLTHEERIARFRSQGLFRAIPDPRDADIARLREALVAAKAFVAEELELRKGDLWEDDSKARDCLAVIEAALGKEAPGAV